MSQLVYKRVTRADGRRCDIPYEIFTQEEAAEREIKPLSRMDWRERFFDEHQDLTGQYILTDDTPPLVAPVLKCYISNPDRPHGRGGYIKKLYLPWTHVMGKRNVVLVGVKVGVISQQWKALYGRVTVNQRKLFILLVALGCGHNKAVMAIWGLDQKVDQNWFRKRLMGDPKTEQVLSELARDIYTGIGASPEKIAKAMWDFANDSGIPAKERKEMMQNIADRITLDDREEKSGDGMLVMGMRGTLESPPVQPRVTAHLAKTIAEQSDDDGKATALIELQSEEAPDE